MPALDAHRIFISTVTAESGAYRARLAERFKVVSIASVFQEEFEYSDADLIEKLYQLIQPCNVLIHFVGSGAGATANPAAVRDFLEKSEERGEDFPGFWKQHYNLGPAFFETLSYTQWEAVIAIFLGKKFMPLMPETPASDGHPPGKTPFQPTPEDEASQKRHLAWLNNTRNVFPSGYNIHHTQNLMPLSTPFHGNHPAYNNFVIQKISFMAESGPISMSQLVDLQGQLRAQINILQSPGGHFRLNDFCKFHGYQSTHALLHSTRKF